MTFRKNVTSDAVAAAMAAILAEQSATNTTGGSAPKKEKGAKGQFYVNVGRWKKISGKRTFISFPYNLILDNMPEVEIRGSSPEFRQILAQKNKLLRETLDLLMTFEPGEEDYADNFVVQLRRINSDHEDLPAPDDDDEDDEPIMLSSRRKPIAAE
jgi:hypothetical protein